MSRLLKIYLWWCGWRASRVVPISEDVSRLESAGVSVNAPAAHILGQFGGLAIPTLRTWWDLIDDNILRFGITHELLCECDMVSLYEEHLGMQLTPVGVITPAFIVIVVSQDGLVFGYWGNVLFEYGRSFAEALEETLVFVKRQPGSRSFENGLLVPPWPEPAE